MEFAGKKVVVVGLAKSGIAAARYLHNHGAEVLANDLRCMAEMDDEISNLIEVGIKVIDGGHPPEIFVGADFIVLSPGVPLALPFLQKAASDGTPIISEVELAYRVLKDKIIAISGSNGKSTTTALTAHLLQTAGKEAIACGNIGTTLIGLVDGSHSERILVAELSSFQLETIDRFKPSIATVLNVTPDHMDRYPDFAAYKEAKYNIFRQQTASDFALINSDEKHAAEIADLCKARQIRFGIELFEGDGVSLENGKLVWQFESTKVELLPKEELSLPGPHNLSNSMAAAAMALLAGVSPTAVATGLRTFSALEHRLEPAGEANGITFINDSKATNIDSAAVALQSFERPIVLLLGGKDKAGDFASLNPILRQKARHVVLVGDASEKIDGLLASDISRSASKDFADAVRLAYAKAKRGDIILLSPGCASFDQFDSFEHRGNVFKQLAQEIING
jgi:UDP-N-acetylmuramoylalanine--D-glutamate ligase